MAGRCSFCGSTSGCSSSRTSECPGRYITRRRHPWTGTTGQATRYPLTMLIKAWLKGHGFDLMTLADLFREGEPMVAEDPQGYYLSFSGSQGLFRDAAVLSKAASLLLHRVNGVGAMLDIDFRPVALMGRFRDETGQQSTVVLAESAEARMRFSATATAVDGQHPRYHPHRGQATWIWPLRT